MQRIVLGLILIATLTACNQEVADFVNNGDKRVIAPSVHADTTSDSSKGIQFGPGAVRAEGNQVDARLSLTVKQKLMQGSTVDAKVALRRNRVD